MQKLQQNNSGVKEFFKEEIPACYKATESNSKNIKPHPLNTEIETNVIIFNRLLPRRISTQEIPSIFVRVRNR